MGNDDDKPFDMLDGNSITLIATCALETRPHLPHEYLRKYEPHWCPGIPVK